MRFTDLALEENLSPLFPRGIGTPVFTDAGGALGRGPADQHNTQSLATPW
jgi:hypothetical protein